MRGFYLAVDLPFEKASQRGCLSLQTGSGKTYTMGTGYGLNLDEHERGIIPRAVDQLFAGIARRQAEAREKGAPVPDFKVHVQFMEVRTLCSKSLYARPQLLCATLSRLHLAFLSLENTRK